MIEVSVTNIEIYDEYFVMEISDEYFVKDNLRRFCDNKCDG